MCANASFAISVWLTLVLLSIHEQQTMTTIIYLFSSFLVIFRLSLVQLTQQVYQFVQQHIDQRLVLNAWCLTKEVDVH